MATQKQLYTVLLVVFISFFALALQYPILAPLFLLPSSKFYFMGLSPEILYGIAIASFPLGQFVGAPITGTCSDIFGRRKTLLIMITMLGLGFLLYIYAIQSSSFILFTLARFFTGFWEGIIPLTRAIATDINKYHKKIKSFGMINAATTLAYLVGPLMAGLLSLSYAQESKAIMIFSLAFVINIFSILILYISFKETNDKIESNGKNYSKRQINNGEKVSFKRSIANRYKFIIEPLRLTGYKKLFLMSCLITLSFNLYYKFMPALLVKKFHGLTHDIALSTIVIATAMVISQLFISKKISKYFDIKNIIILSCLLLSLFFIFATQAQYYSNILFINIPLGILIGIIGINIPIYISDIAPAKNQGQIMGLMMSLKYFGEAVMTLISGLIAVYGIEIPIYLAATLVFIGTIIFIKYTMSSGIKHQELQPQE